MVKRQKNRSSLVEGNANWVLGLNGDYRNRSNGLEMCGIVFNSEYP
jgi:hypothetical protein